MSTRSPEAVLAELGDVGAQLAAVDELYTRLRALLGEGRSLDPPIKVEAMAAAARTTEGAVHQHLRRWRAEQAADASAGG